VACRQQVVSLQWTQFWPEGQAAVGKDAVFSNCTKVVDVFFARSRFNNVHKLEQARPENSNFLCFVGGFIRTYLLSLTLIACAMAMLRWLF
jgi:hypothetical protein